jgi:hypothetical protein
MNTITLSVDMLSLVIQSVIMLKVIMLIVKRQISVMVSVDILRVVMLTDII